MNHHIVGFVIFAVFAVAMFFVGLLADYIERRKK